MKMIKSFIIPGIVAALFFLIFGGWIRSGVLSIGDWPYLYPKAVSELMPFSTWDTLFNNGMGQSSLPKIWFDAYALTIVKLANFLSWPVFERVVWFFPYLFISFFGAYFLSKKFFLDKDFNISSGVIYSLNTYILLIVSGGQAGVFTAYAFLPIIFYCFHNMLEKFTLKRSLIFSLTLALLLLLDLRVGYMFLVAEFLLGSVHLILYPDKTRAKILFMFIIPGLIAFLLHFFWILPILIMGRNPASQLTEIYTSSKSLDFFSFAKIENTVGLLHPNWSENIFGKVAFLKPEFLIVPILAFSALLFVSSEKKFKKISILSLSFLGLVGIFLSKGTNDPFGELYRWIFDHIPGFVMFRDPTKWYMLIAISFCILIPYSLEKISGYIKNKFKLKDAGLILCFIFVLFWAFLIKDAINGMVKGTLHPREISANYNNFADVLAHEEVFSRTLWIPTYPTFAYVSNTHPAIPAVDFFSATSETSLLKKLKDPKTEKLLADASIKYVIVPEDVDQKIFVTDRKYDERVYIKTLEGVSGISYLSKKGTYGKIVVFTVKNPKGHFWSSSPAVGVQYKYISPTKYEVNMLNAKKGEKIIFTESYDKFWKANTRNNKFKISNTQSLNSFVLPRDGSYSMEVYYQPQSWLNRGLVVSSASLLTILLVLAWSVKKGA